MDTTAVRAAAASLTVPVREGNVRSVEYLGYHLRTLLHRNDTMGMAASIESRFPFLDSDVVSLAVNMPYHYKIRYSPIVWEKAHPFVRDKWVVRAVADRYIPRALSQRIKIGFWTTAFARMRVAADYFDDSFPRELFGLSRPQLQQLLARADNELVGRLLHLDVWARVCLRNETCEALLPRLRRHVRILPD
jgi:asparagine synthase (glutamine-hydrolysing)